MKIAGIVAEYNPFHNGHAYHIEKMRCAKSSCRATHIVAVMSGNFVQRGGPAMMPKNYRVRAALYGGADLVLELPMPWAMASAEAFAFGAVSILDALGCVDILSFGSECGEIGLLDKAVSTLESQKFSRLLHLFLDMGISFPQARQRAVTEISGNKIASLFETANNTLGIEYIKALRRLNSPITPFTVRRFGAGHDEDLPIGDMASASTIRKLVNGGRLENAAPYMPPDARNILNKAMLAGQCPADNRRIERAILAVLRTMTIEQLSHLPGISEGLENRLYDAIRESGSLDELTERVKTRRYTLTRIRRIIFSGFLGLDAGFEKQQPPYIRVLGVNERGTEILRAAKKSARLPLVSRVSRFETLGEYAKQIFSLECRASDLYGLALPTPLPCSTEYTNKIVKVNNYDGCKSL